MFEAFRALFSRKPLAIAKRSYDAAQGGYRWRETGQTPSQVSAMLASREPIARRSRYAVGNQPLASSARKVFVGEAIGTGMGVVPMTGNPVLDGIIKAAFDSWCDRADFYGLQSFEGTQAAAASRYFTDGEFFALLVIDPETGELRIKALDPAQVNPALSMELPGGSMVIAGIEVDSGGKPIAIHAFRDWIPGLPLLRDFKITRVPIGDVLHLYDCEAAGQARGISPLASVLLRLRELDALTDAQLVRQKIGALLAGFVTDSDGTLIEGTHDGNNVASLEPGTMQRLRPGESVTFSDPPQTDAGAEAFSKGIVREIGAGIGIPSFLIDNDMSEVNFSSARVALIAFRRRLEQWQDSFAHQFLRPVYRRWLAIEILSGRIEAELNEQTLRCKFIAPKSVWVDPLKDSQSTVIALGAGLTSSAKQLRRSALTSRS